MFLASLARMSPNVCLCLVTLWGTGLRRACLSAITSFAAMHDSATVEALDLGRLLPALSLDDAESDHFSRDAHLCVMHGVHWACVPAKEQSPIVGNRSLSGIIKASQSGG
jgi:hypothetical protein